MATPRAASRRRHASRSDGANYGKMLALRFPTGDLIPGPRQIEARIDQDSLVAEQLTLWNQAGSQVIRGNLLMVPIGTSYLYIEPLYLRASTLSIPESVALRVHERLGNQPLQTAFAGGHPLRVICLGDLHAGVTKKPRNILKVHPRK